MQNQSGDLEPPAWLSDPPMPESIEDYGASVVALEAVKVARKTPPKATTRETAGCAHAADSTSDDLAPPILDRQNPMASAREFMRLNYRHSGVETLKFQAGLFYQWDGASYPEADEKMVEGGLWKFLDGARIPGKGDTLEPFLPTRTRVGDVLAALKAQTVMHKGTRAPSWLDGDDVAPPATEFMACRNGLLHLPTRELWPASPAFWCHNAVDFDYQPDAPEPKQWLKFLNDLWDDDPESVATLQELFGYLLTPDTSQQKIFLLAGTRRSGKGTIGRVLSGLLGKANIAAPTLASLCETFGLQPLIGKSLALIGDARIGARSDQAQIAERLLSISGEDDITIGRKFLTEWTGRLGVRFLILTNELPRLTDASGALASRFIAFKLRRSFYGREDTGLLDRLIPELPGILNWAIQGWVNLRARGRFVQPASARASVEKIEEMASPISAFVKERCVMGKDAIVDSDDLYSEWVKWCQAEGRREAGTKIVFGRDLMGAFPDVDTDRRRDDEVWRNEHRDVRTKFYTGIGLA